jgi:hypothetical protein
MFLAHLSAALTHLSTDVRLDALAVLEALTEAAPALLAADVHLLTVLKHYTGLLSRTNRGKSVKSQALTGLLKVLNSLQRFLAAACGGRSNNSGGRSSSSSGNGSSSSSTTAVLMAARSAAAHPAAAEVPAALQLLNIYCSSSSSSSALQQQKQQQQLAAGPVQGAIPATAAAPSASAAPEAPAAQLSSQALQLMAALFDCWAEAAPASLAVAPEAESTQVLVQILSCCQLLLDHLSPAEAATEAAAAATAPAVLSSFDAHSAKKTLGFTGNEDQTIWLNQAAAIALPRLLKVFPVRVPSMTISNSLSQLLERFNLIGLQLLSNFMAGGTPWPQTAAIPAGGSSSSSSSMRGRKSGGGAAAVAAFQNWRQQLLSFMTGRSLTDDCAGYSARVYCQAG